MPKIPKHLEQKEVPLPKKICIACGGTGKNSKGAMCHPCNGKGVPYVWVCPHCKREHHGFQNSVCRNEKCVGKRLRSKS